MPLSGGIMSTVPSATAGSKTLSHLMTQISRWNTRTVFMIAGVAGAGLAVLLVLAYRHFFQQGQKIPPHLSPDPKRFVAFDKCAVQTLPFDQCAPGIISIDTKYLQNLNSSEVFVQCYYHESDGSPNRFFSQPLPAGPIGKVFVSGLPYQKEMTVTLFHINKTLARATFTVDRAMGEYRIVPNGAEWKVKSDPCSLPEFKQLLNINQTDPDEPLSISIKPDGEFTLASTSVEKCLLLQNASQMTHIVFFKIFGVGPSYAETIVVPIVIPPGNQLLPISFLRGAWIETSIILSKSTTLSPELVLHYIQDSVIP
jgi:hypothetical protein